MEFKMPHIAVIIGLVCIAVALIFQIVGVAAVGWAVADGAEVGLWESCNDATGTCTDFEDSNIEEWLEAVRAFGIIGLLVIVGCVVVGVLLFFMDNKMLPLIAAILAFVAAFCLLIEFAVYAGEREEQLDPEIFDLGYCFALTVVAFLLCIVSGICFIVPKFVGGDQK